MSNVWESKIFTSFAKILIVKNVSSSQKIGAKIIFQKGNSPE